MPKSSAPAKVTSRYHNVSLARIESARMSIDNKCISGAVNGANQRSAFRFVFEFVSQAVDVYVEGILLDLGCTAPTRLDEFFPRGDQAAAAHERFQQLYLLAGKRDLFSVPDGDAAIAVEGETSSLQDGWRGCVSPPRDRTYTGEEN